MAPLLCAAVSVAVLALSLGFPWLAAYRDASFYRAPPELSLPGKFAADEAGWSVRRWRSGTVLVQHDAATLARVADEQGPPPAAPVRIAYRTTYAASTADGDSGGGSVGCDPSRHLLLVHGTGMLGDMYVWSAELLRGAGHEKLAAALSPQLGHKSVAARVHDEPGFCVTTIDLRGHGRSASTAGPWSVELLAADIAAAVRLIHGEGVRVHVNGLSLGFGVALSLAFNYPSLVLSVSGGGFLADHRTDDWLPWLFSRPAIIRVMGVQLISLAAETAIVCRPSGSLTAMLKHVQLTTYLRASGSWTHYNEATALRQLRLPLLWLHPRQDALAGLSLSQVQAEFDAVPLADTSGLPLHLIDGPTDSRKRLVLFKDDPAADHCHALWDPDAYFAEVLRFARLHSDPII